MYDMETYPIAILAALLIWPSLTNTGPKTSHRWATGITGVCCAALLIASLLTAKPLWPAAAELGLVLVAIDGIRLWNREWQPAIAFGLMIAHATSAGPAWTAAAAAFALVGAGAIATIEHAPRRERQQAPARRYN